MTYKIVLVIGLPGSGKTYLARQLVAMDNDSFLVDDPMNDPNIFTNGLKSGKKTFYICDPLLILACKDVIFRYIFKKFGDDVEIEWIYFENNPEAAWENHEFRCNKEFHNLNREFFDYLSSRYEIPEEIEPLPINSAKQYKLNYSTRKFGNKS